VREIKVNARVVRVREAIEDPMLGFGVAIRKGKDTLYIAYFFTHLSN